MLAKQNGEWIDSTMKNVDPLADAIEAMPDKDFIIWTVMMDKKMREEKVHARE